MGSVSNELLLTQIPFGLFLLNENLYSFILRIHLILTNTLSS